MSARARRFFGCLLPLALLVAGCGTFFMLGYAGQVAINLDDVRDRAMAPVLAPGMTVLVNNTAFWYEEPYRPAIVTVGRPEGRRFRRLVGLPGETIVMRDNEIEADGQLVLRMHTDPPFPDFGPVSLGPGEYFVLAQDPEAEDSRTWGPLKRDDIFGVATFYRTGASGGWRPVVTPEPSPTPRR